MVVREVAAVPTSSTPHGSPVQDGGVIPEDESLEQRLQAVTDPDHDYIKGNDDLLSVAEDAIERCRELEEIHKAAQDLYDNRLGWSDGRNPYAHPDFWEKLRQALEPTKGSE